MALEAALWSQLPPEILETGVLPFLPVQDLCRYRCVSKRWDHKICTPLFRTLCSQHPDSSSFVVRYLRNSADPNEKSHGWCFLDMKERRWYTVKDIEECVRHKFRSGAMAMDGGLFCQFSDSETPFAGERRENLGQVIVYNPLAKTVKKLPTVPLHSGVRIMYPDLNMVVDGVSGSFKVFLIDQDAAKDCLSGRRTFPLNDPIMHIYNSATNEWKSSLSPVRARHGISHIASSAVFRDHLYVFLTYLDDDGMINTPLWRYDLVRDTWENVHLPPEFVPFPQLVAAADGLFVVGWSMRRIRNNADGGEAFVAERSWCFEGIRVNVDAKTLHPLFLISEAGIMSLLDSRRNDNVDREADLRQIPSLILSVSGCGNSLVFISVQTGNMIDYDLVTGSWGREIWPPIPMGHFGDSTGMVYGKQMKLLLPGTSW